MEYLRFMKPLYTAYSALTSGLFLTGFPPFWLYTRLSGRHKRGLRERLGFVPYKISEDPSDGPNIWIHAVSLGEVRVAAPIIASLKQLIPKGSIILSTTTDHGKVLANDTFGNLPVLYAPIDVAFSVKKALARVRPRVMVFLETEIWPAWLVEAHRMGIKTALINGRISKRSIGRYLKFRPFFKEVLKSFDAFSMILDQDARRIIEMGADPGKIEINGNAKYELLANQTDPATVEKMRQVLNLHPSQNVFVAGSTRDGEETHILDVFEKIRESFPDTVLIIAPRHIDRTPAIESLLRARGLTYQLRTDLGRNGTTRGAPVVVMNSFGELFSLYSVGTINFCGASLVPLGGQNPLEAAAWGKPVFYGPFMDDFVDATVLLEGLNAGIQVSDSESFAKKAIWFLEHPEALKDFGNRARQAAIKNRGAALKHAKVVARLSESPA
jgi:3-deoxy-D-manno-octulosonic-acid transferase